MESLAFIFFSILCSSDPEIIKTIRDYVVVGSGPFRMLSELTLSIAGPALAIITEIFYSGDERGVPGLLQRHQCQRRPGLLLRPDGEDGLETLNSSIIAAVIKCQCSALIQSRRYNVHI